VLRCSGCGAEYEDDGYRLECDADHGPALLVTRYAAGRFEPDPRGEGVFRYASWLPCRGPAASSGGTVSYRSTALSRATGIDQLWISFNGYWPERGATLATCTFKELEASVVLSRLPEDDGAVLVIASAGNTAAAFARICSQARRRCLIVVPDYALPVLRFDAPLAEEVKVVAIASPGDYADAIALADRIAALDGFVAEGGVRNVGRRDGLGTNLLSATEAIGRMPDHYVQAVGSGAGAIAAHEAAGRLLADGRYGDAPPRLLLCQNAPFAPLHDSWRAGGRAVAEYDDDEARERSAELLAPVLSNRRPPYATSGGVFDALTGSRGDVAVAGNDAARAAQALFADAEGVDIEPAAGVALACLLDAVRAGRIDRGAVVSLNVTGGGRRHLEATSDLVQAAPALELGYAELGRDDAPARAAELLAA
jgi:cysteate synthase